MRQPQLRAEEFAFALDRLGVVRWMSNGLTSEEELAKLVDQLLAEADAPGGQEQP